MSRDNPLTNLEYILGGALGLVVTGIGWFLLYQQTQATQALTEAINKANAANPPPTAAGG